MRIEFKAVGIEPVTMENSWEKVLGDILTQIGERQGSFDLRHLDVTVSEADDINSELLDDDAEHDEYYVWEAKGLNIN